MRGGCLLALAVAVSCWAAAEAAEAAARGQRQAPIGNEVDADAVDALAQTLALLNGERPCAPCGASSARESGPADRGGRRRGSNRSDSSDDSSDDNSDDSSDSSDSNNSNGGGGGRRTLVTRSCPALRSDWCVSGRLTDCECCPTCLVYLEAGASCGRSTNARCRPPTLCLNNSCVYTS